MRLFETRPQGEVSRIKTFPCIAQTSVGALKQRKSKIWSGRIWKKSFRKKSHRENIFSSSDSWRPFDFPFKLTAFYKGKFAQNRPKSKDRRPVFFFLHIYIKFFKKFDVLQNLEAGHTSNFFGIHQKFFVKLKNCSKC